MFQKFNDQPGIRNSQERIASLRDEMKRIGSEGFLIPRSDAHQGEYIQASDARLKWISGFSGSAGLAVVLSKVAALFVDGRYMIQAVNEVNKNIFEIVSITEVSPAEWLSTKLVKNNSIITFDPWLHSITQINDLKDRIKVPVILKEGRNLVDTIWHDKPKKNIKKVNFLGKAHTSLGHEEKISIIIKELKKQNLNHAVITLPDSISWLLNIRGNDIPHVPTVQSFAIINRDHSVDLFVSTAKLSKSLLSNLGTHVRCHTKNRFKTFVKKLMGKIFIDPNTCPLVIQSLLNQRKTIIIHGSDPCILPKSIKNKVEIEGSKKAHLLDGLAMAEFLYWFSKKSTEDGLNEIKIVQSLEAKRKKSKLLKDISFDTICGSGPNGAIVHYRVNTGSNRLIKKDDLILIDSGGQYEFGTTDITRTLSVGQPSQLMRQTYTLVLKGLISISRLRWPPGLTGKDIDAFARFELWRQGFDYDHGTGHGVGAYLSVHEGPQGISKNNVVKLKPGMIVSVEPGYYKTDCFGIRIENLLLIQEASIPENGEREMLSFKTLTICPIETRLIIKSLLSEDESLWLNQYHLSVYKKISPLVGSRTRKWLNKACSPI